MSSPIAVMSFNRPQLLEKVLESLNGQTQKVDPSSVHLFQDGAPAGSDNTLQEECVAVFKTIFPSGTVHYSEKNLGVALNFERAETLFFDTLKSDYAFFFEDDLVLNEHYIDTLSQMVRYALDDERIAYVSAYGNYKAPLADQETRSGDTIPMGHKWGFALTRRQWLRQKPIIDKYLDIVRQRPYAARDHATIQKYFNSLGYSSPGTSQDAAKDVASLVLGTVKLNTFACFGKNIGAVGLHSNQEFYEKEGFGRTEMLERATSINPPSGHMIDNLLRAQRRQLRVRGADHFRNLIEKVLGSSPYEGFEPILSEPDLQGWNGNHPVLQRFGQQGAPEVIIDVGVWKGQSTVTLASAQNHVREDGIVIAIDSFLGSPQHWDTRRQDVFPDLRFVHGRPQVYETFLSNMVLKDLKSRVLPITQTSHNAYLILKRCGIRADVIHLDAGNDYASCLSDMKDYWDLLQPGGVLVGDNFVWPGIARAVVHFAEEMHLEFQVEHPKWWIRKPK